MVSAAGMPDPNDPRWRRNFREEDLAEAHAYAKENHVSIVEALLALRLVGEREIWQMMAQSRGMAFADLDRVTIDPKAVASVPLHLIRCHQALPLKRDGRTLFIAFDDPDPESIKRIQEATGMQVIPVMCKPTALQAAIAALAA